DDVAGDGPLRSGVCKNSAARQGWKQPGRNPRQPADRQIGFDALRRRVVSCRLSWFMDEPAPSQGGDLVAPSCCAYCGALAERPVILNWAVPDEDTRACLDIALPLCIGCSQSWCPPITNEEPAGRIQQSVCRKTAANPPRPGVPRFSCIDRTD